MAQSFVTFCHQTGPCQGLAGAWPAKGWTSAMRNGFLAFPSVLWQSHSLLQVSGFMAIWQDLLKQ